MLAEILVREVEKKSPIQDHPLKAGYSVRSAGGRGRFGWWPRCWLSGVSLGRAGGKSWTGPASASLCRWQNFYGIATIV